MEIAGIDPDLDLDLDLNLDHRLRVRQLQLFRISCCLLRWSKSKFSRSKACYGRTPALDHRPFSDNDC